MKPSSRGQIEVNENLQVKICEPAVEGQEAQLVESSAGGARLTGKVNRFDLGVMNMQTKESPDQPATNYSVVRVRRGLFGRLCDRKGAADRGQ